MCLTINWVQVENGKNGTNNDCYSWYKAGNRYLMRWSGDEGKNDAYRDDEPSRLSKGDKVSKDLVALKKQEVVAS